jgi:acyl-CoA synthetase (AMP-forming)/AMP-acid ligase II
LVVAYPRTGELDVDGIRRCCDSELADFKRPRYLVHAGEPLPRNALGKVTKGVLRQKFRALPPDAVVLR